MSTDTTAFSWDALPDVVARYLEAHVAEDYATAVSYLAEDVTVLDDGKTLHGREETRELFDASAEQFTVTTTLHTVARPSADVWEVGTHLSGDFPGGEVDLRMLFTVQDDVIRRLEITV
jgi:ketosteroid isomerase-like protein